MDECELEDVGETCAGTCINTIGSFRCSEEDDVTSQENPDNEDNEEVSEAIQETVPSTTTTTTTTPRSTSTTATTTPAPTTTTTAPTTTDATTTTSTTTESPVIAAVPVEEEDEGDEDPEEDDEEGDEGEEEEPEEVENKTNRIVNSVTTTTTTMAVDMKEENKLDQTCPEGFQLADQLAEVEDGSACLDVDECDTQEKFGCSHLCINTQGSAHCECPNGWNLNDDAKTCQGNLQIKLYHLKLTGIFLKRFR